MLRAALGAVLFFLIAPATVAGIVPWWLSGWRLREPFLGWGGFRLLGSALILVAVPALLDAFARFVREGRGTPAPYQPTERLVVSGLYRHVRNPMYLAVVSTIVGQGLLFGDASVLVYAACAAAFFHAFVLLYEEPTLRRRFGEEYEAYCRGVRRWWPRLRPWARPEPAEDGRPGPTASP